MTFRLWMHLLARTYISARAGPLCWCDPFIHSFMLPSAGQHAAMLAVCTLMQTPIIGQRTSGGMWVTVPSELVSMREVAMLRARPKSARPHQHFSAMQSWTREWLQNRRQLKIA